MQNLKVRPFMTNDLDAIRALLKDVGWEKQYVDSQLHTIPKLLNDSEGEVCVAVLQDEVIGYIQIQHRVWNRLSYIIGLVVSPAHQKQGVASSLIAYVENTAKQRGNRGLYVDTPVDNLGGCAFYLAAGFAEAYIMPEFYEPGLDGITFQKLFYKQVGAEDDFLVEGKRR